MKCFISTYYFPLSSPSCLRYRGLCFPEQTHTVSEVWGSTSPSLGMFSHELIVSDVFVLSHDVYQLFKFQEAQEIIFSLFLDNQIWVQTNLRDSKAS